MGKETKPGSVSSLHLWLAGKPRDKWDKIKAKAERKYRAVEDFAVEQVAWREDASPAARRLRASTAASRPSESPEAKETDKLKERPRQNIIGPRPRGSSTPSPPRESFKVYEMNKLDKRPKQSVRGPRDPPPSDNKSKRKSTEPVDRICLIDKQGNEFWYDGAPGLEAVKAEHEERMKVLKEMQDEEEKEREQKDKKKEKRSSVRFDLPPEKKEAPKPRPKSDIPTITVTDSTDSSPKKKATAKAAKSGWSSYRNYEFGSRRSQRTGSPDSGSSGETVKGIADKAAKSSATGGRPRPAYVSVYDYLADAADKQPHHTVYPVPGAYPSENLPQSQGFSAFRPQKDVPPSLSIAPPLPKPAKSTEKDKPVPDTPFLKQESPKTKFRDGVPDWTDLPSRRKVREQNRETYLVDKPTKSARFFDIFNPPRPRTNELRNGSSPQKPGTPPKIKRKPVPASSPIFTNAGPVGLGISHAETMPELAPSPPQTPSPVPAPLFTRRPRPPGWDQIQKWSGPNGSQASSVAGSVCGDAAGSASASVNATASEYSTAKSGLSSSPAVSTATTTTSDPYKTGSIPGKWAASVSTLSESDELEWAEALSNDSKKSASSGSASGAANHVCGNKCYATGCCADMVGDNKAFMVGTGYPPRPPRPPRHG